MSTFRGRTPDLAAMEKAVKAFLEAAGLAVSDPQLEQTPRRVAEAWATELIDGYQVDTRGLLGEAYPVPHSTTGEMVVLTHLRFHSVCPHHLLPYQGWAHLAYIPGKKVVGFGRLCDYLDAFAHRLILQEDLAREVASGLALELGSPGVACVLEAEQGCLRLRGPEQYDAVTHAEAYEGRLRKPGPLRAELWARIRAGNSRHREASPEVREGTPPSGSRSDETRKGARAVPVAEAADSQRSGKQRRSSGGRSPSPGSKVVRASRKPAGGPRGKSR